MELHVCRGGSYCFLKMFMDIATMEIKYILLYFKMIKTSYYDSLVYEIIKLRNFLLASFTTTTLQCIQQYMFECCIMGFFIYNAAYYTNHSRCYIECSSSIWCVQNLNSRYVVK